MARAGFKETGDKRMVNNIGRQGTVTYKGHGRAIEIAAINIMKTCIFRPEDIGRLERALEQAAPRTDWVVDILAGPPKKVTVSLEPAGAFAMLTPRLTF